MYARNSQTAPAFVNMDLRVAKRFNIGERVKAQVLFEMFNLFNRDNPAAVNGLEPGCRSPCLIATFFSRRQANLESEPFNSICPAVKVRLGFVSTFRSPAELKVNCTRRLQVEAAFFHSCLCNCLCSPGVATIFAET